MTRRVKAACQHWIVQEKKGRKIFSKGVWAPAVTIDKIRADLEAERSTEGSHAPEAGFGSGAPAIAPGRRTPDSQGRLCVGAVYGPLVPAAAV